MSTTRPSPGVADRLAGASGTGMGVADAVDAGPAPEEFTARARNQYSWKLARPVIWWDVVVAPLSLVSAHRSMSNT